MAHEGTYVAVLGETTNLCVSLNFCQVSGLRAGFASGCRKGREKWESLVGVRFGVFERDWGELLLGFLIRMTTNVTNAKKTNPKI